MNDTGETTDTARTTPVLSYAFMYEDSDIPPGMTLGEFRAQRPAKRRRWPRHMRTVGRNGTRSD